MPRASSPPGALTLVSALLATSCSAVTGDGEPSPGSLDPEVSFVRATTFLEGKRFQDASTALREVATRCENGEHGRRALLLLAALHLDPRNPDAEADSAALMAARYLHLPDLPIHERALGQNLYVLALDRGGDPGLRPSPADPPGGLARRFSDCGEPVPERIVSLPVLFQRGEGQSVSELTAERDSVRGRVSALSGRNQVLRARVEELEAELERIRRILRARPDTSDVPPASRPR